MASGKTKYLYSSGSTPLEGYTIKRGIGVGGFGEVYFALSDAGKEVALKRIQRNMDIELRGVRQCLNLKHVNLISLWDIRTNNAGESWVVMEYVPGKSLREQLEIHREGLPDAIVKTWFASTASGVAYLHERGIVHRDLKPGNIFCDEDEQVIKIGDYGLSKFISCSKRSGQTESVGTFHYMAPEIGKGSYGKEIDIYALGIILFELLTGEVPFNGESSQEIIMKHLTAIPDLSTIPEPFREGIGKALAKDPVDRYSSVPEMLVDLPWEDLAEQSQQIISRNAIGPLSTYSNRAETDSTNRDSAEIQPMFLKQEFNSQPGADIIFGAVNHSPEPSLRDTQPLKEQSDEIAVISQQEKTADRTPPEPLVTAEQAPLIAVDDYGNKKFTFSELGTPIKALIFVGAAVLFAINSKWALPITLVLGAGYLVYFAIQSLSDSSKELDQGVRESRIEVASQHQKKLRSHLGLQDFGDKSAELLGSVLTSSVACIVVCAAGLLIGDSVFSPTLEAIAIFVWMTLVSGLGSWMLLISGKFWEARKGAQLVRRGIMVGGGALIGVVAYLIAMALSIEITDLQADHSILGGNSVPQFGIGIFPAHLIFFTVLFGILRWWTQADPTRQQRLDLWVVGLSLVWAVLFAHLLSLNPIWHGIIAIATSVATQLAAPWLDPKLRQKIHQSNAI